MLGARLAASLVLACAPAAAADSPWLYGIHWFGPTSNASDVNQMTGNKPVWVLETVMTNEGTGQWGPQGQLARLQAVAGMGHTIILRVQPVWGKAFPLPGDTNPSMATFLDQVSQTAALYASVCRVWHLGNEMNLLAEWGSQPLSPEAYIDAAVQFSDRIKAVASGLGPQTVLVGPPGVGNDVGGGKHMGNTEYLSRMCDRINANGYHDRFDGFALHAYGAPIDDGYMDLNRNLAYFETEPGHGYQHQIGVLDGKGFAGAPIYITEWNRYTGIGNGTQEHVTAQFLHTALARLNTWNQSNHPVVSACWFIYANDPGWPGFTLLGLKNAGTQDEDAWHAFQYAAGFDYPAGTIAPEPGIRGDFDGDDDVDLADFGHLQACFTGPGITQSDAACQDARLDDDDDVDPDDFGLFQACLSGAGVPVMNPACAP